MFCRVVTFCFAAAVSVFHTGTGFSAAAAGAFTAEQILKKTVERAQTIQSANKQSDYSYTKFSVTEEFNGKGRLKEKKEKLLQFESGRGRLSQLKLNGRTLTGSEFRKQ